MSTNWKWNVTVGNPPRGGGTQANTNLAVQSMLATFAWGSNPGTATIVYVGAAPVTIGALVSIQFGKHYFTGICKSDVTDLSTGGNLRTLEFVDVREFLQWDYVYCAFNIRDVRIVNGVRTKRYKHLYPINYDSWTWTYSNSRLTGTQIVSALLGSLTIGTPWTFNTNGNGEFGVDLLNVPVDAFDALEGKRLDAALNEVAAATGTVFGLTSSAIAPYLLVFTRKGAGSAVTLPAARDDVKLGIALSGHPTRIRVLGGRNLYQAINLDMEKDWAAAWEVFLDDFLFVDDIFERATDPLTGVRFNAISGDTEFAQGYTKARAHASTITVREYVALRNAGAAGAGTPFVDQRKFAGMSRMDMPALLYIKQILFHAFRPTAAALSAAGIVARGDIVGRQLCRVSHDYSTGVMTHFPGEPVDGNGYAIAKGFQQGDFSQIKSDTFQIDAFTAGKATWGVQSFQVDDSGEGGGFILFGIPIFTSANLFVDVDGYMVLNAAATLQTPPVKVALTFECERFSWVQQNSSNGKDAVENISGLNAEYSGSAGIYTEIPYADGQSAPVKASAIASSLLARQFYYTEGGHKNIWDGASNPDLFGTTLSSMVDRIQLSFGASQAVVETVDYTNERQRDNFEPERELERKTVANSLVPGQAELRQQAEISKAEAAALKQNPRLAKQLYSELRGMGSEQPQATTWTAPRGSGTIAAGTPMRRDPTKKACAHPTLATAAHTVFAGLTVHQNVDPAKRFNVATTGVQLARVRGPVAVNDTVGLSGTATDTFLVKDGTPSVGKVLQAIADASTKLVKVMLGAGGGTGGGTDVKMYRLKALGTGSDANLLRCHDWDGSSEGTTDVWIMKPYKLWNNSQIMVEGVVVNYVYNINFDFRVAIALEPTGQVSENQIIVPRYVVPYNGGSNNAPYTGDIIHAGKLKSPQTVNAKTIEYVDLNVDGRAWARQRL